MKCASALSTVTKTEAALDDAIDRLASALGGGGADLVVAFVSAHHAEGLGRLSEALRQRGLARHVLACTAEAVLAEDREIEDGPAVGLWALQAEGVRITPYRITFRPGDDAAGIPDGHGGALILLGDPFTFPSDAWLKRVHEIAPDLPILGGMASGSGAPGGNRLVLDDLVVHDGAVAVHLDGPLTIRSVVSQGCRPIGRPMIVTKADRNRILEFGRRPATEVLREVFDDLSDDDRDRVRRGLHVGRVINEYQETFGRGDFLVRNVVGADDSGAIVINDLVRVGQTVQFHVRDAETADDDLKSLLDATPIDPAGALIFTCNGRGTRLFPGPDHDLRAVHGRFGPIPAAGFFAMGEIGPIGGRNFVHGFTASIALFSEP